MQSRTFTRLMAVLLVGLFSLPAFAQYTRDKAARKKIDEAINQHYLMMELDKAEAGRYAESARAEWSGGAGRSAGEDAA